MLSKTHDGPSGHQHNTAVTRSAMGSRQRLVRALLVSAAVLLTRFGTGCSALFMIRNRSCQSYRVSTRIVSIRRSSTQGEGRSQEHVHSEWTVPAEGLSGTVWDQRPKPHLTSSKNATLPIALMVIAPELFPTRSKAMRAIRQKHIVAVRNLTETSCKADARIYPFDFIKKQRRHSVSTGYEGLNYARPLMQLPVVYEDDYMAIVNKPSGMICHSLSKGGFDSNSVLRALPHVLVQPKAGTVGALKFPSLVHRLDAPTCGLLVVAKTYPAAASISTQFATRQVKKIYTALLQGTLTEQHGRIDSPIDNKPAVTEWNVIQEFCSTKSPLTLVTFRPLHGRKHQLRRHAVLGCPIVGDDLYGSTVGKRLFLCATEIELMHPLKEGKVARVKIELHRSFAQYMEREQTRFEKYKEWLQEQNVVESMNE